MNRIFKPFDTSLWLAFLATVVAMATLELWLRRASVAEQWLRRANGRGRKAGLAGRCWWFRGVMIDVWDLWWRQLAIYFKHVMMSSVPEQVTDWTHHQPMLHALAPCRKKRPMPPTACAQTLLP